MSEPSHVRTTRAAYDAVAEDYAEHFRTELETKPLGRAMLASFAELVRADDHGPVAELGCGPGQVAAHLHSLGMTVTGVDLSPRMIALARQAHPHIRFDEGSMTALELPDSALGGLVAWYSIIHLLPDEVPAAFAEFHRVLAAGGHLLLTFQVGDEPLHVAEAFGRTIGLDFQRWSPDRIGELLHQAGFVVTARLLREPDETETVPQAHVLARKPAVRGAR